MSEKMIRRSNIVFGPIQSRRLGASLGVNLLPVRGKLCNFDCVYCEVGWNRDWKLPEELLDADGNLRKDAEWVEYMPSPEQVYNDLAARLHECLCNSVHVDSITFSGNGEPTLHPEFEQIIEKTIEARDKYYPTAMISVLSNATRLKDPSVRRALMRIEKPVLKVDALDNGAVGRVNRPVFKYDIDDTVEWLKEFKGRFVLQTMFFRSPGWDSADPGNLKSWFGLVRATRPMLTTVYSLDREAPDKSLEKYSASDMAKMVGPLLDEGFNIRCY